MDSNSADIQASDSSVENSGHGGEQESVEQAQKNVNSLLAQMQTTNDPQEAKDLAAQLSEQVGRLPS